MVRRWKAIVIVGIVLACFLLYQVLQSQMGHGHHRLNNETFFKMVKELQRCPWMENSTEHKLWQMKQRERIEGGKKDGGSKERESKRERGRESESMTILKLVLLKKQFGDGSSRFNTSFPIFLRENFQKCCNASYFMIITEENTPLGHVILYDSERRTVNVTESIYRLFAKTSPFQKPIKSCAVVGNGGILINSFCGTEIDRADFVFRLNLPPLNWTNDVGRKTDLVSANPSILIDKYSSLSEERKAFINKMKHYGSSLVLLPAFSFSMNTRVSLRAFYTIRDFDMKSRPVFFNPHYLRNLSAHWRSKSLRVQRLSSGLMLASAATEVCEKVTLYGFWPFPQDLDGVWLSHHYYDNVPAKPGFHSMPNEFYWYLKMHAQGALRLNLGQC
ncbi:alpha-N-acetylneuraminide alpha-2,8-sialyltransferase-like [Mantella aurantiaca]